MQKKNEFLHPSYPKLTGKVEQAARLGQLQELVPEAIVGEAVVDGESVEYPMIVRSEVDPQITNQDFGIISFILADEPKKLSDGSIIYGLAKMRGNHPGPDAALVQQACTKIIRATDSKYPLKVAPVGKWFPIIKGKAFTKENIDVPVDEERIAKEDILKAAEKKRKEEQEYFERRSKELQEGGDNTEDIDSLKYYVTKRNVFMFLVEQEEETVKKLDDIRQKITKVGRELKASDVAHPTYTTEWVAELNRERAKVGMEAFVEDSRFQTIYESIRLD